MNVAKLIIILFFLFALQFDKGNCFEKIVIWGHKLHSHTHSYIHNAFYIAFEHLGYETYWFDNNDDTSSFDFSNTLFITEGQVDELIPLRNDCEYMLHNCDSKKYSKLPDENWFSFQVYTDSALNVPNLIRIDKFIYYDLVSRCVYMPWASDLLPEQIDEIKKKIPISPEPYVAWVGSNAGGVFGNIDQLTPFITASEENGLKFIHKASISVEENIKLISRAYMAPAIVGKWQKEVGYIPCRIFKNISYGKMGITNSRHVFELFDQKIVYNPDEYQLFYDARTKMETMQHEELIELMNFVRDKHTYINRIKTLLDFLSLIKSNDEC